MPEERRLRGAWGLAMTMGILLVVLGVLALLGVGLTSLVSVIYLGVLLIVVGILEIVSAFRSRHVGRQFLVYFLAGILSIVVGALFLDRPLASLASLTMLIAGFLFAGGLFRGIHAIFDRYPQWGWDLAYAVLTIALGAYVAAQWPVSAMWVLGTIVAIEIIARGVTLIAASWTLREIEHRGGLPGAYAPAH